MNFLKLIEEKKEIRGLGLLREVVRVFSYRLLWLGGDPWQNVGAVSSKTTVPETKDQIPETIFRGPGSLGVYIPQRRAKV